MIHYAYADSCKRIVIAGLDQKSIEMAVLFYFPFGMRLFHCCVANEREISQTCPLFYGPWPVVYHHCSHWDTISGMCQTIRTIIPVANNFSRLIVLCCGRSTQSNCAPHAHILSETCTWCIVENWFFLFSYSIKSIGFVFKFHYGINLIAERATAWVTTLWAKIILIMWCFWSKFSCCVVVTAAKLANKHTSPIQL